MYISMNECVIHYNDLLIVPYCWFISLDYERMRLDKRKRSCIEEEEIYTTAGHIDTHDVPYIQIKTNRRLNCTLSPYIFSSCWWLCLQLSVRRSQAESNRMATIYSVVTTYYRTYMLFFLH